MRKISIAALLGICLLVGSLLWRPSQATASGSVGPAQSPPGVGSWLADIDILGNPDLAAQALLNLGLGGSLTIVDTTDMGGHPISSGLDGVGYGAWEVTGNTITLRYVVFNYELVEQFNDDTGEFNTVGTLSGYTRITDVVDLLGPGFDEGVGIYSIESFGLEEDPLGPPKDPILTGLFTMRRITVD
jgi:hypothetical protein